MVVIDGNPAVVGGLGGPDGYSENIYKYLGGAWIAQGKLSTPRYEHAALTVPDSALTGCSLK